MTVAPAAASSRASWRPMPEEAPVTTAIEPGTLSMAAPCLAGPRHRALRGGIEGSSETARTAGGCTARRRGSAGRHRPVDEVGAPRHPELVVAGPTEAADLGRIRVHEVVV